MMYVSKVSWDVLHGLVVKNKPFNAWDLGPIPGWRTKIPHAEGQLSPCVSTAQRVCSATRERPQSTARTQHSQKKKKKKQPASWASLDVMECNSGATEIWEPMGL